MSVPSGLPSRHWWELLPCPCCPTPDVWARLWSAVAWQHCSLWCWPLGPSLHIHRLDVHEFLDPVVGQLAPVATGLHATEWETRIRTHERIHKATAGLDLLGRQPFTFGFVLGKHRGAEAKARVVRHADSLGFVRHGDNCGDWPKELLVVGRHAFTDVREHGRRIEGARALGDRTAQQTVGAFGYTGLDLLVQVVPQFMPG